MKLSELWSKKSNTASSKAADLKRYHTSVITISLLFNENANCDAMKNSAVTVLKSLFLKGKHRVLHTQGAFFDSSNVLIRTCLLSLFVNGLIWLRICTCPLSIMPVFPDWARLGGNKNCFNFHFCFWHDKYKSICVFIYSNTQRLWNQDMTCVRVEVYYWNGPPFSDTMSQPQFKTSPGTQDWLGSTCRSGLMTLFWTAPALKANMGLKEEWDN